MANITVKNIPEELYERLKEEAKRNHRSMNGEIIAQLEHNRLRPTKEEIQRRAEITRSYFKEELTDKFIIYAKNYGRE